MSQILNGQEESLILERKVKEELRVIKEKFHVTPKLSIILVGENPASQIYVQRKGEKARVLGIETDLYCLPETASQKELETLIKDLNKEPSVHGILLQLPLPGLLDKDLALNQIDPSKDVDCLTSENVGLFFMNRPRFLPCTPQGCLHLISLWKKNIKGLNAVIIGRSLLVGTPVARLILNQDATVIQAHSYSQNLKHLCRNADILISAAGYPDLIQKDWVKPGACVIDVGITRNRNNQIVGDVCFDEVRETAGAISPVPGGVGPLTVMFLMKNVVHALKEGFREK